MTPEIEGDIHFLPYFLNNRVRILFMAAPPGLLAFTLTRLLLRKESAMCAA
jgi:hypothetical protein